MEYSATAIVSRRRSRLRWGTVAQVIGVSLLLAAAGLSTFNAVTTERFTWDLTVTEWVQKFGVGDLRGVLFWMGVRGFAGMVMVGTAAWLWLRGNRVEAVMIVIMLIPDASSFILRDIYDRPRPSGGIVNVYGGPQGFSYPSGTAMHSMLFYGWVIYLLPRLTQRANIRYPLSAFLVGWIVLHGLWVVHHGRHWPSDVLGGYLYGLMYLIVIIKLYPIVRRWDARRPQVLDWVDGTMRRLMSKLGLVRSS